MEKKGLGRGLSALLADVAPSDEPSLMRPVMPPDRMIPIERIHPNPNQPRRTFDEKDLQDLANSIREKGVIQPLILRPLQDRPGEFQIVAGERRWRAAQVAEKHELPGVIRELSDAEVLELAIIENIQRADLNSVEEALGYRQLMDRFGHTQEKLAEGLSKSRSHIANLLRLLTLPVEVQDWLRGGKLTAGHARALVTAEDPVALARKVMSKGLSVRETEQLARVAAGKTDNMTRRRSATEKDADTRALEQDLSANLGLRVAIDHRSDGSGQLSIGYKTLDQLDQLCQVLSTTR